MPSTLTIRTPADIISILPPVYGFFPHESVCILAIGSAAGFSGLRVDIPPEEDIPEMVDLVVEPTARHSPTAVIVALVTDDSARAELVNERLILALTAAGLRVVESVQYRDGQVRGLLRPSPWDDVDIRTTEIAAQTALEGLAPAASREEAREWIAPRDPVCVPEGPVSWARSMLYDDEPTAETIAQVLAALPDPAFRDTCIASLTTQNRGQLDWWTLVARRAPEGHRALVYGLLALAAWCNGDGALSWIAHDLSVADGGCTLTSIVASLNKSAVPPSAWGEMRQSFSGGDD